MVMDYGNHAHTKMKIKGVPHKRILPEGIGLVLEGGGARTYYSAGIFEAFMEAGIMFPYIIGVSAGIANALTYVAGQRGRNRIIAEQFVQKKEYYSLRNLLKLGSVFDFDYIFNDIPEALVHFDREIFESTDIRFLTGAFDCVTGDTIWFEKHDVKPGFHVTRASCSVPLISRVVKHNGYELLDGGIAVPIPIEKSIEDGNDFHVIILTYNEGYISTPYRPTAILKPIYKKYPKLSEMAMRRHELYNKQLALCEQLERDGKAIILRPKRPMEVTMLETDPEKLLDLYDEGHTDGKEAVNWLEDYLGTVK